MRILKICLLVCFTFSLQAQQNSLLWKISAGKATRPSYLFGTIHIADQRVFRFGDSLCNAFKSCKIFAGELDLIHIDKKSLAKEVLLPSGITLADLVGDTGLAKIKQEVKRTSPLLAITINRIRPFYIMGILAQSSFKSDRKETLDEYLQKIAKKNKMKIIGLETMEDQIGAVNSIPLQQQAEMLMDEIKQGEADKKEGETMLEMYLQQNTDSLASMAGGQDSLDLFTKVFLIDRNIGMSNSIHHLVGAEGIFIAVGAAHLGGQFGIINNLRRLGYTVKPVILQ